MFTRCEKEKESPEQACGPAQRAENSWGVGGILFHTHGTICKSQLNKDDGWEQGHQTHWLIEKYCR